MIDMGRYVEQGEIWLDLVDVEKDHYEVEYELYDGAARGMGIRYRSDYRIVSVMKNDQLVRYHGMQARERCEIEEAIQNKHGRPISGTGEA